MKAKNGLDARVNNSSTFKPYEWLKQMPSSFLKLDKKIPSVELTPPFPWKELSEKLRHLFQLESFDIEPKELEILSENDLLPEIDRDFLVKQIKIDPLNCIASVALPKSSISTLLSSLLQKKSEYTESFDKDFQEAFLQFLTVEVMHQIGMLDFDKELSYYLLSEEPLTIKDSLCLNISITLAERTLYSKLIFPANFLHLWKARHSKRKCDFILQSSIASKVPITIHLQAGQVELTQQEFQALKCGDFVVLDACSIEPDKKKGRLMLFVNQRPFMRAKLKEGKLKLLETPILEVKNSMDRQNPPKEPDMENEEHYNEEVLDEDEIEDEDEVEDEEYLEEDDLSNFDWNENEVEDEEHLEEKEEKEECDEIEEEQEESESDNKEQSQPRANFEKISPETLPIPLVIEVGRIEMPLQKLMELQPGNVIELEATPESGVDLVVNGKKIAEGELLLIGETLGVRITNI